MPLIRRKRYMSLEDHLSAVHSFEKTRQLLSTKYGKNMENFYHDMVNHPIDEPRRSNEVFPHRRSPCDDFSVSSDRNARQGNFGPYMVERRPVFHPSDEEEGGGRIQVEKWSEKKSRSVLGILR